MALATSTLRARRLAWAMLVEAPENAADAGRLAFRRTLAGELETLIRAAIAGGTAVRSSVVEFAAPGRL